MTSQKQVEVALAAQKARMDLVFENMDQGVILYDQNMFVTAFNEQARRHMRFPKDVLFNGARYEDLEMFIKNRDAPNFEETEAQTERRAARMTTGDAYIFEHRHSGGKFPDGELPDHEVSDGEFPDGEFPDGEFPDGEFIEIVGRSAPDGGFIVTYTNTTERKRVERALMASEAQFRSILDANPSRITLKDREGIYQLVNKAFLSMYNVTAAQVIGATSRAFLPEDIVT